MIQIYGLTNCGNVRKQNQDCFTSHIVDETTAYAVVCDGMGGENAGDIASSTACTLIDEYLKKNIRPGLSEITVRNIIASALQVANTKVYTLADQNEDFEGMGTTVVLVIVMGNKVYIAHVGDSRIYVKDKDTALLLTTDHTVVQTMLQRGEITSQEAAMHPQKHFLTRALGVQAILDFDYDVYEGFDKDMSLLLCSDGFSNYVKQEELPKLMKKAVAEKSAQSLIDYANEKGGHDNITAVIVAWSK